MNGHAVAARHEPCDLPAAVEQWMAFITAQEQRYASLAATQGEALVPHTPEELRAVTELAAALGIHPDDMTAHGRDACVGRRRERRPQPARTRPLARDLTTFAS